MTSTLLRRAGTLAGATGGLLLLAAAPAAAHETWFVHHPESYPLQWEQLLRPAVVAGAFAAVVVTIAWRLVATRVGTPELRALHPLSRLVPWVPRLLALHLGLSLLLLTLGRAVLDPAVVVPDGWRGTLLLLPQAVVGALLVSGRHLRVAAVAVVAAGPVLLVLAGVQSLLMCLALLGIALFLVAVPDARAVRDASVLAPALLALRLGTAGTLLVLAVVEKLANPAMGEAMLAQEPALNLLAPVGVSAGAFVLVAGLVELLFALLVLSGAAPQVVALVAAVPFTASLALFGGTELIGHLPVYGVLLVLLVLGSDARTAPLVRRLPRKGTPDRRFTTASPR